MTDKPTITQADRDALDEAVMECVLGDLINGQVIIADHRESAVAELQAEVERLRDALKTISMMHGGNPSDIMADIPIADYRAVVIGEMKKEARAALAQKEPVE